MDIDSLILLSPTGGVVADAEWDGTAAVQLNLTATGSIYDHHDGLRIDMFPQTGHV